MGREQNAASMSPEAVLNALHTLRDRQGARGTPGLPDRVVLDFAAKDPSVGRAVEEAVERLEALISELGEDEVLRDEADLVMALQSGFVNFYAAPTVNPYVALAARGPWIVTSHGALLHDNGGYGMLGAGHGPDDVLDAMSKNHVMANVMTPSFSQHRFIHRMRREVGHARAEGCPFSRFICMNSGSESMTVAMRIADVNALRMTAEGAAHAGQPTRMFAIERAFHGRTDRPAQISHSCMDGYNRNLRTFQGKDNLHLIPANNIDALRSAFAQAEQDGVFVELLAIEPVQGEGAPGVRVERAFYDEARRLTLEHGSMLIIDSVQAGFRGQGCLSIVDYPGFEDAAAPDMEAWSKAINAGQYPLSVLGMTERAASTYVTGIYGNTMTTNPRALETAIAVLDRVTPELRRNILERGEELVAGLQALMDEFPNEVLGVTGSGLLVAAELEPERLKVVGDEMVEMWCRRHGLGIIHGGINALRYTPHFGITSDEVALVVDMTRQAIEHFRNL